MKTLSLRQPWAWAVLHGKSIENRRWNTRFRGEFLIHAAKGMTQAEYAEAHEWIYNASKGALVVPRFGELLRGGVVGSAELVSVVLPCPNLAEDVRHLYYPAGIDGRWHMPEQFGFVLANVKPLPFRPLVGHLGFFDVAA